MNRMIFFNMMTVDGFFEGPARELGWHNVDNEFNDFAIEQLNTASLLVFGRVTYELMASYWPSVGAVSDDPIVAGKMNSIPKIVFSKTLKSAEWNNTRLMKEVTVKEFIKLKEENDHNIFIFGSANLSVTLRDLDLIDEYRIIVNPLLLGMGNTLFKPSKEILRLKLLKSRQFKSGNVLLYYEPVR